MGGSFPPHGDPPPATKRYILSIGNGSCPFPHGSFRRMANLHANLRLWHEPFLGLDPFQTSTSGLLYFIEPCCTSHVRQLSPFLPSFLPCFSLLFGGAIPQSTPPSWGGMGPHRHHHPHHTWEGLGGSTPPWGWGGGPRAWSKFSFYHNKNMKHGSKIIRNTARKSNTCL